MTRLFVRHNVSDYDAWRKVYDDFDSTRRSMGVTGDAVYRSVADPNDVTVTHDFDTPEEAKEFVESAELRQGMGNAGVAGDPQIWITATGVAIDLIFGRGVRFTAAGAGPARSGGACRTICRCGPASAYDSL